MTLERKMKGRTTAGEFERDGVVPLGDPVERSEAPRGKLDSPWKRSVQAMDGG